MYSDMMNICIRYFKNESDAVDVLNTGFLKIFTHLDSLDNNEMIFYWCRRIMINTAIDKIRNETLKNSHTADLNINIDYNNVVIQNDALSKFGVNYLLKLIHQLPKTSKTVFNLFVFDKYSHREIAEKLNITEHTSQWHMLNARRILQKKINKLTKMELTIKY